MLLLAGYFGHAINWGPQVEEPFSFFLPLFTSFNLPELQFFVKKNGRSVGRDWHWRRPRSAIPRPQSGPF